MDVLSLGIMTCDILVKVTPDGIFEHDTTIADSISLDVGGDALNVAVNLSKMGIAAGVCGKVGDDSYGDIIKRRITQAKVDTKYIGTDITEQTSTCIVLISPEGKRNFLYYPGATSKLSISDIDLAVLDNIKVLAIGSYFSLPSFNAEQMEALLKHAKAKKVITVLDVTNNPTNSELPIMETLLPHVDYFLPSYDEARDISGLQDPNEIASFFKSKGAGTVIIKLGEHGALGLNAHECVHIPAFLEDVIDTTGAGDCFVAGIIASLLKGYALRDAMVFACKAAGLSVTKVGATTATLPFDEIAKRHTD